MRIKQVIDHIKKAQSITFIIGAGASRSAGIPLASGLVDIINRDYGHCLYDLSDEERQDYGKAMSELSPADRKALIQPLLDKSVLNWGHFALAGVIDTGKVKRVLSFNFDFLLERAAALHGYHLPVYDFGVSPTRDITGLAEPALFHLHGQSYGLRLLNSEEETRQHTEALEPLVADCVRNGLTIVTGYSGEADAAFELIERNYNSNQYLIWLGYAKDPAPHLAGLFAKRYATYIGDCDFDRVMIEIAQGLNCFPPSILQNPPQHVLEQLKNLPTFPVGSDDEHLQLMDFTRDRLQQTADGWVRNASADEQITAAFLEGKKLPEPADPSQETETRKQLRASQFISKGNALLGEALELSGLARVQKLREAGRKYAAALAIQPDQHEALNNWGVALSNEAQELPAKFRREKYKEAIGKYSEALEIKPDKAESLKNWGLSLLCEAVGLDDDLRLSNLRNASEKFEAAMALKPLDHRALNNWGEALLGEALLLSGEMRTEKFRAAGQKYEAALEIKPDDYIAWSNWGYVLCGMAKVLTGEERAEKLSEAVSKLQRAREISGRPIYTLARCLVLQGRLEEALDELEACEAGNGLPDKAHLEEDTDMDSLREHPRFIALMERLGKLRC